jgi:hypothetical protein
LISHRNRCLALPIAPLTTAVCLTASFAGLVPSVRFAVPWAADRLAASGAAIPLPTVTTEADREQCAAFRRAADLETKNRFSIMPLVSHANIMSDLMIERTILPSTG